MSFSDDFLQGQKDCKNHVPHVAGKSEAYTRGYNTEYTAQQVADHNTVKQNERIAHKSGV